MTRVERRVAKKNAQKQHASALLAARKKLAPLGFPEQMIRNFAATRFNDRALEVYSTGKGSPEALNFDVYSLRIYARTRTPVLCQLSQERLDTIISDGGVDPEIAKRVAQSRSSEPVIVCQIGDFECLVDGNHRAVGLASIGELVPIVRLDRSEWEPFLVPNEAVRWLDSIPPAPLT